MLSSSSSEESLGMSALPQPPKLKKKSNTDKENIQQYSTSADNLLANRSTLLNTDNSKLSKYLQNSIAYFN